MLMIKRWIIGISSVLVLALSAQSLVIAQPSNSTNYELDEVFIGPGGTLDSSSSNFDLRGTLGDLGVGESSSTGFNLLAGFTTDAEPTLGFVVVSSTSDLGVLDSTTTATANGAFSVATYNAEGYVVQTISDPPTNQSGYTLNNISSPSASTTGTEQFGMNLVANIAPTTFGANPVQVPDGTFSFGSVASDYATANLYKYVVGDTVASSNQSTGQTDYTTSYIYNVAGNTPSGEYQFDHVMVATSTF